MRIIFNVLFVLRS